MTLLAYNELVNLVEKGIITGVSKDMINASSIDITLGEDVLLECRRDARQRVVSLADREPLEMLPCNIAKFGYTLAPGEFVLAHSQQIFNLPDYISAEYKLKSSMARIGLEHLNAGWCDAGWNGSVLTLELKNMTRYHAIKLCAGDRIGQVVFFEHSIVPAKASYGERGRYNNDITVTGVKP